MVASQDLQDSNSDIQALYFQAYMLALVVYVLSYFFTLMIQGKKRKQVFNAEFMAQFNEEHR